MTGLSVGVSLASRAISNFSIGRESLRQPSSTSLRSVVASIVSLRLSNWAGLPLSHFHPLEGFSSCGTSSVTLGKALIALSSNPCRSFIPAICSSVSVSRTAQIRPTLV
ncbi:hypothetical protein D3C76_657540 [compost metagenome]